MIKYVLMDIEGTTTPIAFVHDVLFPYSRQHLGTFLREHGAEPAVVQAIDDVKKTALAEGGEALTDDGAVQLLLAWIAADRKHPALKTLQGMIWEAGYAAGAFQSEIYPDVQPCLAAWRAQGLRLGIYSSGSVQAQKLLFSHTPAGDLTPLLSDYFDTSVGMKRQVGAYHTIAQRLGLAPEAVVFLSDVEEELDMAAIAGLKTVQVVRPGTAPGGRHPLAADFVAVGSLVGLS